jgi:hypothetical protein
LRVIINPDGLRRCIEGNVVQGTSRALSEEVVFDRAKVTSTDWLSYPILDITEAPETVDIVLINRLELPPAGAVFDATGVRLRRAPLTPQGSSRCWRRSLVRAPTTRRIRDCPANGRRTERASQSSKVLPAEWQRGPAERACAILPIIPSKEGE